MKIIINNLLFVISFTFINIFIAPSIIVAENHSPYLYECVDVTTGVLAIPLQKEMTYEYTNDFPVQKIKTLLAPLGTDETQIEKCTFIYHPGFTEVINAGSRKKIYRFNTFHQITSIEDYHCEGDLYRAEHMCWEGDYIISHWMEDAQGRVIACESYSYDDAQRLVKETIYGNLSGTCLAEINLHENFPVSNGIESYSTHYRYDDKNQVIEKREDNGKIVKYLYDPQSSKICAEFLGTESDILIRNFYKYAPNSDLIETIADNGKTKDLSDLSGVTARNIIRVKDKAPEISEEYSLDLNTGEEVLLKKSNYLQLDDGHLMIHTDNEGTHTEFRYDSDGKCLWERYANNEGAWREIHHTYDFNQRLIRTELINQVNSHVNLARYDYQGNQVASIDNNGNETQFEYDIFTRKISQISPTVLNCYEQQINPIATFQYDILDRVIISTDPNGYQTSFQYNARGKPTEICHSDGSCEKFEYNLDGSLNKTIGKTGSIATCETDILGKINQMKVQSSTGKLLNPALYLKPGDQISRQDKVELSDHFSQNEQFLNDRGQHVLRQTTTNEYGCSTIVTFDALNRIESMLYKDAYGTSLDFREYRYDAAGNKVKETNHYLHDNKKALSYWRYGLNNRLEEFIEGYDTADQRRTLYSYNSLGQLQTLTKPDGIQIHYEYDCCSNLIHLQSSDQTIDYRYFYDENRNVIRADDLALLTQCVQKYDSNNRLLYEKLSNGLTLTSKYDSIGRRTSLVLPDLSFIAYEYDAHFLKEIHRLKPNGQLHYSHVYDTYNEWGQLTSAFLIGGLGMMSFRYDSRKRCREIESLFHSESIPENGTDAFDNVTRLYLNDFLGKSECTFRYDQKNQLVSENTTIASHKYVYDSLSNRIETDGKKALFNNLHELQNEKITYDSNGNLIKNKQYTYLYDALDRLITVLFSDTKIVHTYDPFHRRMTTQTLKWNKQSREWQESSFRKYIFDMENEIGAANAQNALTQLRVLGVGFGAEIGAAVAIEIEGRTYAPLHNLQGSVSCLIDLQTKSVAETYRYTAFGEQEIYNSDGKVIEESIVGNPWTYHSKRKEADGSLFFGKRYYDPSLGRWMTKDPLGYMDGPNRYVFTRNNPLSNHDLYGLFSIAEFWDDSITWLMRTITKFAAFLEKFDRRFNSAGYSLLNYIRPEIESVSRDIFGNTFLLMMGFWSEPASTATYGLKERNDKIRITSINGVLNLRKHCLDTAQLISRTHGSIKVHYIHRPTEGWASDLIKCVMTKMGYTSPAARQLAEKWKGLIQELGGVESGGRILHYAHSIGGTDTVRAGDLLSPEEQKMIHVVSMGSATMIPSNGFGSVVNYVSWCDGVCYFDPIGYIRGLLDPDTNIVYIGSPGIPLIDHSAASGTYGELFRRQGELFVIDHPPLISEIDTK